MGGKRMGLGLYLHGKFRHKPRVARTGNENTIFRRLAELGYRYAKSLGSPFPTVYRAMAEDDALFISFLPIEENVEFSISNGHLIVSAKTSSLGPGYHAALVGFLDSIEQELELKWIEGGDYLDETGYFGNRDIGQAQRAMADLLGAIADSLLKAGQDGCTGYRLSLPIECAPIHDAFAISLLGEWSKDWFFEAARAQGENLLARAREFFPWWDFPLSGDDYRKLGLAFCWVVVTWVCPSDASEAAINRAVLSFFDRAREYDASVGIPEMEERELERLITTRVDGSPSRNGIGFCRRDWQRPLTGGWTVRLPGYFHSDSEDNGETQVYHFGPRMVCSSSFEQESWATTSSDDVLSDIAPDALPLSLGHPHLRGGYESVKDEKRGNIFVAHIAKANSLCVLTIPLTSEVDLPWAIQVARSVFIPPDE
jgi:hypothetical protein